MSLVHGRYLLKNDRIEILGANFLADWFTVRRVDDCSRVLFHESRGVLLISKAEGSSFLLFCGQLLSFTFLPGRRLDSARSFQREHTVRELRLLGSAVLVGRLQSVVHFVSLAAHEHDLGLARSNSQVRQLREIVPQHYTLNEFARNLFSTIRLVKEEYDVLLVVR